MSKMFLFVLFFLICNNTKSTIQSVKNRREAIVNFKYFKYQASIRVEYDEFWIHHCSGAILNDNHVVTAASCIYSYKPMDMKVVVGSDNYDPIFTVASWHPLNTIVHAYIHKKFNTSYSEFTTFDYDIAIVKSESSFQPSGMYSSIEPAPATIDMHDGQHATMTFWNVVGTTGSCYNKLMLKDGRKLNENQCECAYSNSVSAQMLCFDFDDNCYGETGAPLSMMNGVSPVLIGIYSWHGNCMKANPAIFTRISSFADWIQDIVTYIPPKYSCKSPFFALDVIETSNKI